MAGEERSTRSMRIDMLTRRLAGNPGAQQHDLSYLRDPGYYDAEEERYHPHHRRAGEPEGLYTAPEMALFVEHSVDLPASASEEARLVWEALREDFIRVVGEVHPYSSASEAHREALSYLRGAREMLDHLDAQLQGAPVCR